MATLQVKRKEAGQYVITSSVGITTIIKSDDKWWITFPCGKKSYRRSYDAAKKWAIAFLEKLEKNQKPEIKTSSNERNQLKNKLKEHLAYVTGAEFFGCINSGNSACILHLKIKNKSYYLVGRDVDITDYCIDKNVVQIARLIGQGIVENYLCPSGKMIEVFTTFPQAEKTYKTLNQKTIDSNIKARKNVAIASKNNDYWTLSDYGLI